MSDQEKHKRTEQEILKELNTQEMFIKSNMDAIAANQRDYHKQLALNFRTLFHDMGRGKSLFSQLEWKGKIKMVTTCSPYNPNNILSFIGLVHYRVDHNIAQYGPKGMPESFRVTSFENWWNSEIIINDGKRKEWTRKDLITNVADTDGGAHVDPTLPLNYYNLAYKNSMGITFFNGSNKKISDLENPIPACLWQIGLEYKMSVDLFRKGKIEISFE